MVFSELAMKRTRRTFLATSALAASLATSSFGKPWRRHTLEKLRVGVVGFGGRGRALIDAVQSSKSAIVVGLADVDQKILARQNADQSELVRAQDFRRLLDRKDIDVIVSATPNHWHALVTVLSVQAGKHVYIEKPISYNMFESEAVVAAADKYGKIVQCGFQNRSDSSLTGFYDRLSKGEFGKVLSVQGTCYRPRKSIGKLDKPLVVPSHIDYSLWLGPAEDQPLLRPRLHYDWHWDFNTGNGDVGNQGPHEWDLMNWALGDTGTLPTAIQSAGGRFGWNDAGNTPNVMVVSGVKDGIPFTFEVMDLKPGCKPPQGQGVGVIVTTQKGRFVGGRGGGRFVSEDGKRENFKRKPNQDPTRSHMQNFLDAVLANDRTGLRSDCKVAANSSSMAHMANISYQLGRKVEEDEFSKAFARAGLGNQVAARVLRAPKIFASNDNAKFQWMLGPKLAFDNSQGQFVDEKAELANAKRSRRDGRAQFAMPEI